MSFLTAMRAVQPAGLIELMPPQARTDRPSGRLDEKTTVDGLPRRWTEQEPKP
jgi:hypothetical protein